MGYFGFFGGRCSANVTSTCSAGTIKIQEQRLWKLGAGIGSREEPANFSNACTCARVTERQREDNLHCWWMRTGRESVRVRLTEDCKPVAGQINERTMQYLALL